MLPLLLLACSAGKNLPPGEATSAPPATQPAPGVTPEPIASGDVSYKLMGYDEFRTVEGCMYTFWPEDKTIGQFVFGFSSRNEGAEGTFGGQLERLEKVSGSFAPGEVNTTRTFVHANDDYEVTSEVTYERPHVGEEGWDLSGTLVIREKGTGKMQRILVLGGEGC